MADSSDTSDREVMGLWIGAVGAAIAVLAFFGISDFDELARRLDPQIADEEACEMFNEAVRSTREGPTTIPSAYGDEIDAAAASLDEAADHANDAGLAQALSHLADSYRIWADAERLPETEENYEILSRAQNAAWVDDTNAVLVFCYPIQGVT